MAAELDLDDVAGTSLKAQRELKELRDTLNAVSDALDYLHGMTPQQAADVRKDAERYRWLRANTGEIVTSAWDCMMFHGGVGNDEDGAALDSAVDAAMAAAPAVGAA